VSAGRNYVAIAELELARAPATLAALGLGSCVAVIMHDPVAAVGGLAHVLLPSPSVGRPRPASAGRFAPTAVAKLVEGLIAMGATQPRLTARLVGGASMFASLQPPGTIQMGERNVLAVREALHRNRIRLIGEVVGGEFGRSVSFDVATGRVLVTSYEHGEVEL
jgi:chemotaxis protein CheD